MDRKEFIRTCAGLAAGAACLDLLSGCSGVAYASFTHDGDNVIVDRTELVNQPFVLLDVQSLPAPVLLQQSSGGDYAAVLLHCTHRGCVVEPAGALLQCPCHGSQYDYGGTRLKGPAPRNLTRFPVSAGEEKIVIDISRTTS